MIIKINEDYQISVEQYRNNVLQKLMRYESGQPKARVKDGVNELIYKTMGYYPDVPSALIACAHLSIEDEHDVVSISEYSKALHDEIDRLEQLVNEVEV